MTNNTRIGGPVDVLAVLDAIVMVERFSEDDVRAARAAVAELIEAAQDVIEDTVDASTYPDGPCISRKERAALKAALANVGGAK